MRKNSFNLTFIFSFSVLVINLISFLITGSIILGLLSTKFFTEARELGPLFFVILFSSVSLLTGMIISTIGSRFPLNPIRRLISAINELAGGNFDVRINLAKRFSPHEFRELTASFNNMARELGSIEILRSDFINNFSHEFKTPIVSIRGFAKLLKYGDLPEDERGDYLDIILKESERLASLSAFSFIKLKTKRL